MLFNVVNEKGLADYNSAPFSPLRHLGKFLRAYYARSECLVRFVGPLPSRHVNEINFRLGVRPGPKRALVLPYRRQLHSVS